jgi:hypothetical protein
MRARDWDSPARLRRSGPRRVTGSETGSGRSEPVEAMSSSSHGSSSRAACRHRSHSSQNRPPTPTGQKEVSGSRRTTGRSRQRWPWPCPREKPPPRPVPRPRLSMHQLRTRPRRVDPYQQSRPQVCRRDRGVRGRLCERGTSRGRRAPASPATRMRSGQSARGARDSARSGRTGMPPPRGGSTSGAPLGPLDPCSLHRRIRGQNLTVIWQPRSTEGLV